MQSNQNILNKVVEIWQNHFLNHPSSGGLNTTRLETDILNHIAQSNLMTVIFSFTDLSILHINDAAARYFGSSVDKIKSDGAISIVNCFNDEQLKFATYSAELSAMDMASGRVKDVLNSCTCYTNWIINKKNGKQNRGLFRIFPIELNEKGMPLTGMYLIHDVSPFLREGTWWYRFSENNTHFVHYHSEEKKFQSKDILSQREKAVLSLLAEGLSSKKIGEQLHISAHTIDNHRRHMLAKTGAVDTSALIHVAKLSGIL